MRLFVALELDEAVRARITALLRQLEPAARQVKWVKPQSLHLSLKFIGEQPEDRLPALVEALAGVPAPGPLELGFRGLGCFPNERHPRVFWVGLLAPPALGQLATGVERALAPLGIEPAQRPFSPHLTLGRLRQGSRVPVLPPEWEVHRSEDLGRYTATELFLYQSRLFPHGAEYVKLKHFPLK